jgi:hypothetical protein
MKITMVEKVILILVVFGIPLAIILTTIKVFILIWGASN